MFESKDEKEEVKRNTGNSHMRSSSVMEPRKVSIAQHKHLLYQNEAGIRSMSHLPNYEDS